MGEPGNFQVSELAPFPFSFVERQLRKKNYGIITSMTPQGRPHSVGVVYGVASPTLPFSLYLIASPGSKKVKNIKNNPNISFAVPFPHYVFRFTPPSSIQFQGKVELIPADDKVAISVFQSSYVLRRSLRHNMETSGVIFIRIVPDRKIFCWGIGANLWQFIFPAQSNKLKNLYVNVPEKDI